MNFQEGIKNSKFGVLRVRRINAMNLMDIEEEDVAIVKREENLKGSK